MTHSPAGDDVTSQVFWSRRYGHEVSAERARQISSNVAGFFRVLAEWDRKARWELGSNAEAEKASKPRN